MARSIGGNLGAFLDAIAWSEGTVQIPNSDDGYNVLVGSTPTHPLLFSSYKDHPRIYNKQLNSTAAGRYQLLARYFDAYKKILNLTDFSPASQDTIAIKQIRECGAFNDALDGNVFNAVNKCCRIWASLPGSPYGQPTHTKTDILQAYLTAGGTMVETAQA